MPTCLQAPALQTHTHTQTLTHTLVCFPMARPVSQQTSDIMLRARRRVSTACVTACGRKVLVIMTYGLDSSFLLGREDREWRDRRMHSGFFRQHRGLYRKEQEGDRRGELKENREINLHQSLTKSKRNECQNTGCLCVHTFCSVSRCLLLHFLYL